MRVVKAAKEYFHGAYLIVAIESSTKGCSFESTDELFQKKKVFPRSTIVRFLKFLNTAEKDPVKLLLDRCNDTSEHGELVMVVTSPTKLFLDKSKTSRSHKFQMQLGRSPNIWLCDRSNTCNENSWQKVAMVPVSLLSDKMRYASINNAVNAGSSPSRWLVLMSMDCKFLRLTIPNGIIPVN
jgi:hypothetical protein